MVGVSFGDAALQAWRTHAPDLLPPSLRERVGEGDGRQIRRSRRTPLPVPPPQGGREHWGDARRDVERDGSEGDGAPGRSRSAHFLDHQPERRGRSEVSSGWLAGVSATSGAGAGGTGAGMGDGLGTRLSDRSDSPVPSSTAAGGRLAHGGAAPRRLCFGRREPPVQPPARQRASSSRRLRSPSRSRTARAVPPRAGCDARRPRVRAVHRASARRRHAPPGRRNRRPHAPGPRRWA